MEKLQAEVKLGILRGINDFHSLCALVLAIPAFNDLYQLTRESVITAVTCNVPLERRITVLTRPCVWVEVCGNPDYQPGAAWRAIGYAYEQMKSAPTQHIRLEVNNCRALLTIKDSIQWWRGDKLADGFFEGHVSKQIFASDLPCGMRCCYAYEYEPGTKLRFQSSMVYQHRLGELFFRLGRTIGQIVVEDINMPKRTADRFLMGLKPSLAIVAE